MRQNEQRVLNSPGLVLQRRWAEVTRKSIGWREASGEALVPQAHHNNTT